MVLIKKKLFLSSILVLLFVASGFATTYNFNNCGASGRTGPSSCSYSGFSVNVVDGIQEWSPPETGDYHITAAGAQGGSNTGDSGVGGNGGRSSGTFNLDSSETYQILVGQEGQDGNNCDGHGGGGASYVVRKSDSSPLIVAAGGGGANEQYDGRPGIGQDVRDLSDVQTAHDAGGYSDRAGGGAGWGEDGQEDTNGDYGRRFLNGGEGGTGDSHDGGFGGGGGGDGCNSCGAGAGYRGGTAQDHPAACDEIKDSDNEASSRVWDSALSYNDGSDTSYSNGANAGHGYVEITQCGGDFNDPSIQSTGYSDSQASSSSPASFATDVNVDVDSSASNPCGGTVSGNTLSSCSVTATGEGGNSYSPSTSISSGTCEFTVDNDGNSAWGPGEQVTLDITVTDDQGGTDTLTDTHTFVDTDVNEISVTSPSDNADGVFGFDSGVDLEFSVTDYEAKNTNKDLSVDILGDSLQNIGTQTVSNGDGSVSIEWERDGEFGDTGMYGFKRGNSYSWNVDVAYASDGTDIGGNSGDPWSFTVEQPPNINGLTPTDGAQSSGLSVQELQNTISVNQMEVEFYLGALGTSSYNIEGTDTVLGSSGAASTNIMDAVQSGDEYEWWIGVDDGHSYIKYDSRVNTFTAPEVLRSATDLYVLPTERPSRDKLNSLESGDESYIWVDNGKLHWVDPATGTERWLQFAQSLSETTVPSGAIWVDGENLVWVGEDTTRYQHVGTNDGSSSLDPGTFWVDSSGYLRYVDGNGNERVMNG